MSSKLETIVAATLPMVKMIGETEIKLALDAIKANNTPEVYAEGLKAGHSFLKLLKTGADKTATKIDDGLIAIFLEVIEAAALTDNITL